MVATVPHSILDRLPSLIDGMPPLAGWENRIQSATNTSRPVFIEQTNLRLSDFSAGFAIALHMHQPTIPAGADGQLISNLQYMFDHPYEGDNHNAGPFAYCYARMGDFIPELVEQGCNPRIMLDYSGTLLWGLQQMNRHDILDKLRRIACDSKYQPYVEWLGTLWGHAVVPSTPIPDIKLHIRAWQHHFAALFGWEALSRVRGFSPPEMHLPNHPDTLYAFVKALLDCGYQWLLVQEHTIETLEGRGVQQPHLPHRLVARNTQGDVAEITVLIKTQGSDTKLVGQMQPFAEAKTLQPVALGQNHIPPLVTQISDGENGGVMMNEFPGMFKRSWHEMRQHDSGQVGTVGCLGTEYLELLAEAGVTPADFPTCQAIGQHRLWQQVGDRISPDTVDRAIAELKQADQSFHMEGSSWTNDRSWVEGYSNVMQPLQQLSARFHQAVRENKFNDPRSASYHQALLHLLLLETSCFRYWGQGAWTEYAQTIHRRGLSALTMA
ncbi:glycosyl hydrolase family 57 [Oscillatoria sp. CS-180]|uniref:glycosyl hydrolase family 57 n=1 Tax=Oscillatoria sp. CS-180 TaxID=3021720 RepID=UPI00232A97D8|nr:glycosyl hydrolase family 57 [Oscillatoria sp. CS-180]MDB9528459.1 glycosyl hydrolase family 57 [Oscillatoria sp. CS-180]